MNESQWTFSTGQLLSAHEGSAAQAGGHLFPKRMGIQPNEGCVAQVATGGPFPKRLGFEVNDSGASQAADGNMFPSVMGVQAASKGILYLWLKQIHTFQI